MTIEQLIRDKEIIKQQKLAAVKHADATIHFVGAYDNDGNVIKAVDNSQTLLDASEIKAKLVINTTNLMDSHSDVHLPGIWTKTLQERKNVYLLQEHSMTFDKIISDDVKASAEYATWVELGFPYEGKTQALIFNAKIKKDRNPFMFEQYAKGYVKEHSVGMRYVKIDLAVNDDRYKEEFSVWEKYIDKIANREDAESKGYFWAVTEAKLVEGSAVVMGSNYATPVMSLTGKENEAVENDTLEIEPLKSTQNNEVDKASTFDSLINYSF